MTTRLIVATAALVAITIGVAALVARVMVQNGP